ncbi:OB-fold nucleic acid binding domain-containing protein [Propionicicella superfundia]|uniref:OB-fold nucleic acid binding domain-containing protein n=1 Tax=Propionicicella superfundia TaxID=348582 RepID=UPI000425CFFB|nr:OB-fold nucleic acid binding domain-containing protein [Propionicicella superfundia]
MSKGSLARAWRRLTASQDDVYNRELQTTAQKSGANSIGSCADRQLVRLRGTITSVTLAPRKGAPWLQVVMEDGSGTVTLVWMGRHAIPGVAAGTEIVVEGRISCVDGERRVYNPKYELVAP